MTEKSGHSGSRGNHLSFVGLLTSNYYNIQNFILAMVPNKTDAEDILQNTITYLWEHFDDFSEDTNFIGWAITVAKFQVFTYRKYQSRSKLLFTDETLDCIAAHNKQLPQSEMNERYDALQECIQKLPKKDQSLLHQQSIRGKKIAQIAREQGISPKILYRHCARLKGNLLDCVRRTLSAGGLA